MHKIKPESLKPGDLWKHGKHQHPWIFLEGNKSKCPITGIDIWELKWFGKRETNQLELMTGIWVHDSAFDIIADEEVKNAE